MTGVGLEKIPDIVKYLFVEKGLKGRVSYIAKRWQIQIHEANNKANNKYMKDYDPEQPLKFITYLDMNNLYGWTMSNYLPYDGLKWFKNVDGLKWFKNVDGLDAM